MSELDVAQVAAALAGQHERREKYVPLPSDSGADLRFGYAVQERLIERWVPEFGTVASWKVGLTTPRMQQMCGVNQPIAGAVFADRIHASPAELDRRDFVRLGIEAELALRISQRPDGRRTIGGEGAPAHVDAVCAAFEIVDDRDADYATLDAVSMVADNSWNAGIVLGQPVAIAEGFDLLNIEGSLFRDGEPIERGFSRDAGGDPLGIVHWLQQSLALRGRALEAGQWVLTGSIVRTQFPEAGDTLEFRLGDFPPARVRIL
jgi:2-keto-4-pentenoate hydratase